MSTASLQERAVEAVRALETLCPSALGFDSSSEEGQHFSIVVGHLVFAAMRAVRSLDYLHHLDTARFGGRWMLDDDHAHDVVDDAHVRWATGSAITVVDLCAATIARMHGLRPRARPGRERPEQEIDARQLERLRGQLERRWQEWLEGLLQDQRYALVHDARNPMTHSDGARGYSASERMGHGGRTTYRFGVLHRSPAEIAAATPVGARKYIEAARDLAAHQFEEFLRRVPR